MSDHLETILKDIAYADRAPHAALRAAMDHAAALTPRVEALARRWIDDDWLYRSEQNLLFYGLFVLAAARERAIWPVWLDMMRQDHKDLSDEFGGWASSSSICAITLSLVDEDVAAIVDLVDDPRTEPGVASALVSALTRLTCEGRHPRAALVDLIDRLASRIDAAPTHDLALDVEEAITLGGLAERTDLLERLLEGEFAHWSDSDKAESRAILRSAAANPGDLARFDEAGIAAPSDPYHALRWIEGALTERDEPASVPLSWRERERLVDLLKSAAPEGAMGFEEIDGLFHALALGPELAPVSEYLPLVYGEYGDIRFADLTHADETRGLLQRHLNTIAQRKWDGAAPRPWIEPSETQAGDLWSRGFTLGVDLRQSAWDAIPEDDSAAEALGRIELLGEDELLPHERAEFLKELPDGLAEIGAYWEMTRRLPVRVQKVGRNELCPCGSGKKWKKCCGAAAH